MPIIQSTKWPITIANGNTTSAVLLLAGTYSLQSLMIPSTIAGTQFTILAAFDMTSTMLPVWSSGNATTAQQLYTIKYQASSIVRLGPADFYGMQRLQFVSNAAQTSNIIIPTVAGVLT